MNQGLLVFFWSPASRLGLMVQPPFVRPFVCSFVRNREISKSVHRNFLIFGRKLGLPNATEVTFSDFGRKIPFWRFWPFYVKKWPFLAKNQHFSQYLKIGSQDLLSFVYLNCFWGLFMKSLSESSGKNLVLAILALFWSKNGHFWLKIKVSVNFSRFSHRIFLVLHI